MISTRHEQRLGQTISKQYPVRQLGERVVHGLMRELRFGLNPLGNFGLERPVGRNQRSRSFGNRLLQLRVGIGQRLTMVPELYKALSGLIEQLSTGRRQLSDFVLSMSLDPPDVGAFRIVTGILHHIT